MGRILIDTRDIRDSARDLRGATGALGETRGALNGAFRSTWFGPEGARFQNDWNNRSAWIGRMADGMSGTAVGLDAYANHVDADQARIGSRSVSVGWVLRPLRSGLSALVAGIALAINRLRRSFARMLQLLRDVSTLIARGLKRLAGPFVRFARALWKWLVIAGGIVGIAVTSILTIGHGLPILSGLRRRSWQAFADGIAAVLVRSGQNGWNAARAGRPGEAQSDAALDRSARWLARPETDVDGFQPGEFGIVDKGDGHVLIVLRGLKLEAPTGNSGAEVGFEAGGFGPYSAQVERAILELKKKYSNLEVSFVGHSEGGIAARNVLADANFWKANGIKVGTVVTIESPVDGCTVPSGIARDQVYQFNNNNDPVPKLDAGFLGVRQNDTKIWGDTDRGHAADQFATGGNLDESGKQTWQRVAERLREFDRVVPPGGVYVYGRP